MALNCGIITDTSQNIAVRSHTMNSDIGVNEIPDLNWLLSNEMIDVESTGRIYCTAMVFGRQRTRLFVVKGENGPDVVYVYSKI